jgi:hypothetical protein
VNVVTPSWTYLPPAPAQPVAQVQAVILAPPAPEVPVYEFGDAVWVKSIVTTSHNNARVELKDLVSDDPNGANNELAGNAEDLPNGDEVVTRRYEFYKSPHQPFEGTQAGHPRPAWVPEPATSSTSPTKRYLDFGARCAIDPTIKGATRAREARKNCC